jgi:hypothetical protein
MFKRIMLVLAVAVAGASAPLGAQGKSFAPKNDQVPAAYRPPPGMCRIWLEGVPPAQQPAPTDCATAVRNRPSNGRVIFGDDYRAKDVRKDETRPDTNRQTEDGSRRERRKPREIRDSRDGR